MPNSSKFKSTPDKTLSATVSALKRLDESKPLGNVDESGSEWRILQNTLLNIARHKARIDWIINRLSERPIRTRLRHVLEWSVAEMVYAHGLPEEVVVDTAVRFVKRRYSTAESRFVNAIMRSFSGPGIEKYQQEAENAKESYVRLELSPELYKSWSARFPEEDLKLLAQLLLEPAPVCVRLRSGRGQSDMEYLQPLHLDWTTNLDVYLCKEPQAFFQSEAFQRGDYYVQDPSTLVAPMLLDVRPGESVLDVCAAPGGKAVLLGEQMQGKGCLVCMDRSVYRLRRLTENLQENLQTLVAAGDGCFPPFPREKFAAVMLDAPCSNTGVIRRRPDVRWRFSASQLKELVKLQQQLLENAITLMKPHGRLVYSTCSIEPEENAQQIQQLLSRHPELLLETERQLLPAPEHDGAYAALIKRR